MTMTFKDNKYATSLSSVMGVVKTRFICDKDDESFSQLVKMFKKKYALVLKREAIEESLSNMPNYSVAFNAETKEILGFLCKKATITINNSADDSTDVFTVFYTNEIDLETPNWCNQFKEIDGVMLEYQYEKYDVWMKFVAQKIKFKKVSDNEFIIDEDYQIITEEKMTEEMEKLFSDVVN